MSHVDEGTLHALVDDALAPDERDAVQAHLATCGDCARRFAEATAMARQVVTLLGALDEAPAAPVRVVAPASAPPVVQGTPVTPLRTRMTTLRRIAIAASVMLVAGVSYQVGRSKDAATALESAAPTAAKPAVKPAQPSVVTRADENALESAPLPAARVAPRGGPRAESEPLAERDVAVRDNAARSGAGAAAPVVAVPTPTIAALPQAAPRRVAAEQVASADRADQAVERRSRTAASQVADAPSQSTQGARAQAPAAMQQVAQAPAVASAPAAAPPVSADAAGQQARKSAAANLGAVTVTGVASSSGTLPKATPIPGYTATEESAQPAIIRRRYVSSAGTPLLLVIVQAPGAAKPQGAARAEPSPEFVVSTQNGRSTVRWQRDGRSYELQGALAPDSLVKLATQLR